jgi:uncharacterized UPF0160 family protein
MSKILAVTHNDRFHADDVFSAATLQLIHGEDIEFFRTRDEEEIKKADIVFDVGGIYDPSKKKFDHHQKESTGERENGIPYAAFGLIWKEYGEQLCGSVEAAEKVDKSLVTPIDAGDNGFSFYDYSVEDVKEYVLDRMCHAFGSTWKEDENYDEAFFEVVKIAKKILEREIILAKHKIEALPLIEKAYETTEDKRFLVLSEYLPFGDFVKDKEEILYVISPSKKDDLWRINAIQKERFENRKDFPKEWSGLRDEDLEKVTGVKGSKFCHRALFLAVADSKESAMELVKLALEN